MSIYRSSLLVSACMGTIRSVVYYSRKDCTFSCKWSEWRTKLDGRRSLCNSVAGLCRRKARLLPRERVLACQVAFRSG